MAQTTKMDSTISTLNATGDPVIATVLKLGWNVATQQKEFIKKKSFYESRDDILGK